MRARAALRRVAPLSVVAGICMLIAMPGCGRRPPKQTAPPAAADESRPTQVTAHGFTGRWMEKLPDGRVRRVLEIHSRQGALDSQTNSGTLYQVDGTIFRDGSARIRFTAPIIEADRDAQKLVARQGVVMRSLDPPGATIRCDTMTWRADLHQIVAEGNVTFDYAPNGPGHSEASGGPFDRITIDTSMQVLTIP